MSTYCIKRIKFPVITYPGFKWRNLRQGSVEKLFSFPVIFQYLIYTSVFVKISINLSVKIGISQK